MEGVSEARDTESNNGFGRFSFICLFRRGIRGGIGSDFIRIVFGHVRAGVWHERQTGKDTHEGP